MEKLTKKDIKSIAGALERTTQNLMEICSMMLRKDGTRQGYCETNLKKNPSVREERL